MANEAVIVELLGKDPGRPIRFTIASATAAPIGSVMKHGDPRTAAVSTADNDPFAGILAIEKVANQETFCTVYTHGIFSMTNTNAAAITAGLRVQIEGANQIGVADAAGLLFSDVGIALEDIAKSTAGVVLVGSLL